MAKRNKIAEYLDMQIGPRVVGGTYRNDYWGKVYTVDAIERDDNTGDWSITVTWDDGRHASHMTGWNKRDSVISQPA